MTRALRRALPSLFPPLLLLLALCFPAACVRGVKTGLETGLFSLIPSLFPSLVLSRLAVSFLPSPGRRTALILPPLLGSLCGFPLGAQLCVNLYRRGALSKKDAEDLLFCSNNAGGIFLVSVCGSVRAGTNRLFSFGRSKRCRALFLFPPIRKIAPAAGGEPNAPSRKKPLSFRGMASFLKGSGRCLRDASVLRDVFFLFDGAFCLPFQACPVFPRFDLSVFRIGGRNGRPIGSADGNGLSPLLRRGRLGWLFGADAIPSFRKRKRSGSEKAVAGKNFSCRRHALFRVFFQKALVKSDRLL